MGIQDATIREFSPGGPATNRAAVAETHVDGKLRRSPDYRTKRDAIAVGVRNPTSEEHHRTSGIRLTAQIPVEFDIGSFLGEAGSGRTIMDCRRDQVIFAQGDPANSVFYIQTGKVKLSVVSDSGREAVIALLQAGSFFGEACLTAQQIRISTAVALSDCSIMRLEKMLVAGLLHSEPAFAEMLLQYMLTRTIRIEEDLVDQLFNSSEKRLARTLLLLANFGKDGTPETVIPKISQETLAEMIGTTRSRVSFFMNKFRRLGFIKYNGTIEVHSSLLNVVLHD